MITSEETSTVELALSEADSDGWQYIEIDTDILRDLLGYARELPLVAAELAHERTCLAASQRALTKAMGELTQCREVLREVEWAGRDNRDYDMCPVCEELKSIGHSSDCALAKELSNDPR